ncbi:hypothetical protein AMS68_000154 [Peltaster fructicola]|uniref:PH domain-containing protein n=1 Tax=Peltaster fructicola TaxID=286661 RepID=A0A6H0XIT7_9PEZI|nr:hypothetical protein AMS68_000154 [Peltaster fructicola]
MAGIEQIVVHSKSYLVRWIQVPEHNSISWSVQPQKKSINFGIFKHPGTKNVPTLSTTQETLDGTVPATPTLEGNPPKRGSISRHDSVAVIDKLSGFGMKAVAWQGNCEADKVTMGRYDVGEGTEGMYGLVFDNTFSKQTGKNVTFVLLVHPTNAPPKSGHHLHYAQAFTTAGDGSVKPTAAPSIAESTETIPHDPNAHKALIEDPRPESKGHGIEIKGVEGSSFYTGVLSKKRRKRGQGYAKRFFSLDFTSSTLSYYQNRHSSALRGAIPLSLAAIGANEKSREFSVDSGAEVWHLRAGNSKDFDGWREALEKASASGVVPTATDPTTLAAPGAIQRIAVDPIQEQEWARIEQLVSKVAGTRDAVRRLAKDTDPLQLSPPSMPPTLISPVPNDALLSPHTGEDISNSYFPKVDEAGEKRPFWKRKSSIQARPVSTIQRSTSNDRASIPVSPIGSAPTLPKHRSASAPVVGGNDVHERCKALLQDLDTVVASFSALIAESKARRKPPTIHVSASRVSLDSVASEEFFDAEDAGSQLLSIRRSSEYEDGRETQNLDAVSEADSDASSDDGEDSGLFSTTPKDRRSVMFPSMPQTLPPLPLPAVKRRTTVVPPKQPPPSIIGFLRKNAGKDLSTVSMPVTANEPTSLLQRLAEGLEYTHLLDSAAGATSPTDRLLWVAAFAISGFAYNRVKERALRKPFNPMLGETYELVREDLGYRFLAEKVSHHPVRAACQADSLANGGWTFAQSPQPVQKFWGKSVELNTEGRARVILHAGDSGKGDLYTWTQATCFLRNVIAGEKYIEPVQTMTVVHEASGARAVASFKVGGMFSGRSEEVNVQFFESGSEDPMSLNLSGKWTEFLKRSDTGATVWKVGDLIADAPKVFGFTSFAAALNEITANEEGSLPPTDSRLRPDQRALEAGDIDKAEALKARLEERQRSRRKVLEGHGQQWKPQFFEKAAGGEGSGEEETWRLKEDHGYWERRAKKDWHDVTQVFET